MRATTKAAGASTDVKKLYPTLDTVWIGVDGRQWVACPKSGCPRRQMKALGAKQFQCAKCGQRWELQ